MDAKPQRICVRGDENAVAFPANKATTIHQRSNKSTSALPGVFHNGTAKNNAPRRAAFGDVSNTANLVNGSRDDKSMAGRKQIAKAEKPAFMAPEKRTAGLSQPPQRPMSTTGLKGILNNVAQPKAQSKPAEPAGKQMTLSQQTANTRKTLNKRGTAVFKDPVQPVNDGKEEIITASKETNHVDASDESKEDSSRPNTALSLAESGQEENAPQKSENWVLVKSDDTEEETSSAPDDDNCQVHGLEARQAVATQAQKHKCIESLNPPAAAYELDTGSYWDEEDNENEEDDGYTTARSFGDNTTGGASTVLFPKHTQQARRELTLAKQIVEATRPVEDIEDEYWDTSMVAEYSDEIFDFMREHEIKMLPNAHYMDYQVEIEWSGRAILMEWLVQVHYRFALLPETLYLTVNYIDRFMSCKIVSLDRIQLVGATALLIAAKYEEINCPSVHEIEDMVDHVYPAARILEAERLMLYVLRFELGAPGPMSFLRRISKADEYNLETRTLAKYFLELTIMDERFVGSPPSYIAAGAHCLSRLMLGQNWSPAHIHYSGYTYSQLLPLVSVMLECCENPRRHHPSIYEKYADRRFKKASLFVEEELRFFELPGVSKDNSILKCNGSQIA